MTRPLARAATYLALGVALALAPTSRADIWDRCDVEAIWEDYLEHAKESARLYARAAGADNAAAQQYQNALDAAAEEAKSMMLGMGDGLGGDRPGQTGAAARACKALKKLTGQLQRMERAIQALVGIQGGGVLERMAQVNRKDARVAWIKARRSLRRYRECCKANQPDPPEDPPPPPEPTTTPGPISSGGGVDPGRFLPPDDPVPPDDPGPPDDPSPPPADGGGGGNPALEGVDDDCKVRPNGGPVSTRARNVPRDQPLDPETTLVKCGKRGRWIKLSRYRQRKGLGPVVSAGGPRRGHGPVDHKDDRAAAQRRVREFLRAYESGDFGAMLRHLAPSFSQDRGILENAVRAEAREQFDIRVDAQPGQITSGEDGVSVRFRWNRTATLGLGGQPDSTSGEATFFLTRDSDYRIDRMTGPLPVGVRDQDLVDQAGGRKAMDSRTRRPVVCGRAGSGSSR